MKITEQVLETLKSQNGGYTKETLALLGVSWPPKRGWKKALLKKVKVHNRKKARRLKAKSQKPVDRYAAFYKSADWRRVRYDVLRNNDGRCELCGVSKHDGARLNVDHIKPLRLHWQLRLNPANLQVLCGQCNHGKGNRDDTDWREEPAEPSLKVIMGEAMK